MNTVRPIKREETRARKHDGESMLRDRDAQYDNITVSKDVIIEALRTLKGIEKKLQKLL